MILRIICIASYFIGAIYASSAENGLLPKKHRTESGGQCLIYHQVNPGDSLTSVRRLGLLSFPKAFYLNVAACHTVPKAKLEARKTEDDIYFTPQPEGAQIAYVVNPDMLTVYNGAYRKTGNWPAYNKSNISFLEYQERAKELIALRVQYPNNKFILAPVSCTPTAVKTPTHPSANKRVSASQAVNNYEPEVVVSAGCISPEKLIFLEPTPQEAL